MTELNFARSDQAREVSATDAIFRSTVTSDVKLPASTLKSIDFITLVDVLSEGEIELSATAHKNNITDKTSEAYKNCFLKDLFLNKQPVLKANADINNPSTSDFNYESVKFRFQAGTADNLVLPAAEIQSIPITGGEIGQIVSFPKDGSVTPRSVTITDVDVDVVMVGVKFEQFFKLNNNNGNRESTSVRVLILINPTNGGQIQVHSDLVEGKSTASYTRDYGIRLSDITGYNTTAVGESGAFFPITVTVSRENDEGDNNTFNQMTLSGVTVVKEEPRNYPHVAYTSLRFSSEEFSSLPSRIFRVRGKKVKIPAEGNAVTAQYTQTGTTITIQKTNHGLLSNDSVIFDATSGAGVDGTFIINSVANDGNSFTFINENSNQSVSTSDCTYKPNPYVDKANGRIVYPNNYVFNGSLKTNKEWTSDPAWILYDLLIVHEERITRDDNNDIEENLQYGCGLPEASIDKFVFQKASEYCSELVNDAQNGQEPRFSLNVNIRTQQEALKLINDICSVMRAMPFYSEGTIKISQDAPKDFANPSTVSFDYVFNNANVVGGSFVYSGSSLKTRFTIINVSYFDLETQDIDYVTIKDTAAIKIYGEHIKTVRTFGTTSKGQAQRVGKWFLNTQQTATETCVFETNIAAGSVVQIGSIIGIADRVKAATRRGGVVKAATTTAITIDNVAGTNQPNINDLPTISCLLSNGTVETRTISGYSTDQTVVNVSSAFSSAPVVNSPYIFESASLSVTNWRVINIKETTKKTYVITALSHNQDKYATVEDGEQLPVKNTNVLTSILLSPSGLTLEEKIVVINNRAVAKVFIDWQPVDGASSYELQYRRVGKDNFDIVNTKESSFEIEQTENVAGSYDIRLFAFNALGQKSNTPTEQNLPVTGLSELPEQPTGFEIEPINNYQVRLSWNLALAKDVLFGGRCLIRHSITSLANTTFGNSIDIDTSDGNTTEVIVPALAGTFSIKFEDIANNLSANETKVEFALPETEDELVVKQQREQAAFSGTKTNLSVSSGALQLTNPATTITGTYSQSGLVITVSINSHNLLVGDKPQLTFTSGLANNDTYTINSVANDGNSFTITGEPINNDTGTTSGNVTVANGLLGRYDFTNTFDLGAVYQNLRLKRHIKSEGFNISDQFDAIANLDERLNFDGAAVDRLKARLTVQTSNDNSTYTSFTNLRNGSFVGRFFKFRANLISVDTNENIKFDELGFDASLPSRVENKYISSGNVISTPIQSGTSASGIDIVFANKFFTGTSDIGGSTTAFLPAISITPFDLPGGGYFIIKEDGSGNLLNAANQNVNGIGFNIIFKNSSNAVIDVKFSFQALGYGKGA